MNQTTVLNERQQYQQAETKQRAELLAATVALQPLFAKNSATTESSRHVCEQNIQALSEAGLFGLMVPKRYGGSESSVRTMLDITSAIAESCGSTAWVTAIVGIHAWFVSVYPQIVQDEVFAAKADARVVGVASFASDVRQVDGGRIISGKWFACSGCLHADWFIMGMMEQDENSDAPKISSVLIPRDQVSIEETWLVAGMQGTGSHCVVAEQVFIPEHRIISLEYMAQRQYLRDNTAIAYRAASTPMAVLSMAGPLLGLARAALQHVVEKAPHKAIAYTQYTKQTESTVFQVQVAQAAQKVDIAHLLAFRAAADIDDAALHNTELDDTACARVRSDAGLAAQTAADAVNLLMTAHGSGGFADASPLQRIWRDVNTASRHAYLLTAAADEAYGNALLS